MTVRCVFERSSGLYTDGSSHDDMDHNPITHIQLTLPEYPDRRTQRWDGADGVRDATAQELSDFDDVAQRKQDIKMLAERGKDVVLVLVETVDWLLDNTAMVPGDFTADVRETYLELKTIAERVKAP